MEPTGVRRIVQSPGTAGAVRPTPCARRARSAASFSRHQTRGCTSPRVASSESKARPQDLRSMLPGGRVTRADGDASVSASCS